LPYFAYFKPSTSNFTVKNDEALSLKYEQNHLPSHHITNCSFYSAPKHKHVTECPSRYRISLQKICFCELHKHWNKERITCLTGTRDVTLTCAPGNSTKTALLLGWTAQSKLVKYIRHSPTQLFIKQYLRIGIFSSIFITNH
jgi:hypothetical protein